MATFGVGRDAVGQDESWDGNIFEQLLRLASEANASAILVSFGKLSK